MESFLSPHIKSKRVEYKGNSTIFRAGDKIHSIFFVEKGEVKLTRDTIEGRSIISYIAKEGQFFAEAALFQEIYHCNAIAITECVVRLYSKQEVVQLLLNRPDLSLDYIQFLSTQIRDLRQQLEVVNILNAKERIIQFMESNAKNGVYKYPGSLKNFASILGLSHETLYRELKKLEAEGLIKRDEGGIQVYRSL